MRTAELEVANCGFAAARGSESADALSILKKARALIGVEEAWCQGRMACKADGRTVTHNDPDAVRWCALGALNKASSVGFSDPLFAALIALKRVMGGDIDDFNDTSTHAEVLSAFDRAIAAQSAA